MNQLYLILLLFLTLKLSAQERRMKFYGKVTNDSIVLENVHVINKTTNKGTVSNYLGEFKLLVKENDILQFSNIQYLTKKNNKQNAHSKEGY